MYVNVVRTCIRCGTNVYLGGTKMGGTKRRWYEKPGIHFSYFPLIFKALKTIRY